jgi:hypothetical protein
MPGSSPLTHETRPGRAAIYLGKSERQRIAKTLAPRVRSGVVSARRVSSHAASLITWFDLYVETFSR